ncbi:hypothetical protein, conserved [Eimeria brunetti]|uniref:Phosphatidate cytidylyltransferase, mitochondrial n=1 Tax=Eimeria brunetti TaxID=51314 RepID=U6LSL3_9EIME|nr:hypothetical protein, conserved [Eimeria brunetti]
MAAAGSSSHGGPPNEHNTNTFSCLPFSLDLPPVECCICYGSSFFHQLQSVGKSLTSPKGFPLRPAGASLEQQQRQQRQQQQSDGAGGAPPSAHAEEPPSRGPPMGDLLLLVPEEGLQEWHELNIRKNLHHYSSFFGFLSYLGGPRTAAKGALQLTRASGVNIFFNCRVPTGRDSPKLCKYGVATTEFVLEDLRHWTCMYTAGRMQKPVSINWCGDTRRRDEFASALSINRRNALRLALLLLPEAATLECLLKQIVSLSYTGDFRVLFAEDPNKAQAIVNGQGAALCSIYLPLLLEIPSVHLEVEGGTLGTQGARGSGGPLSTQGTFGTGGGPLLEKAFNRARSPRGPHDRGEKFCHLGCELASIRVRQDRSPEALSALYNPLPLSIRQRAEAVLHHPLRRYSGFFSGTIQGPPATTCTPRGPPGGAPAGPPPARALRLGLQQLVFGPTLKCSLKNAVSAGFGASVLYSLHKLGKRLGLR